MAGAARNRTKCLAYLEESKLPNGCLAFSCLTALVFSRTNRSGCSVIICLASSGCGRRFRRINGRDCFLVSDVRMQSLEEQGVPQGEHALVVKPRRVPD